MKQSTIPPRYSVIRHFYSARHDIPRDAEPGRTVITASKAEHDQYIAYLKSNNWHYEVD